jgi:hypothetical protein
MKNEIEKLNTSTVENRKSEIDNAIALTLSSSFRDPPCSLWLNLLPFRAYPRLTAPNRGKSRLIAPNRAKNFSGGSRVSNRGYTLRTATNCPRLHQLAHTCAKEYFCAKRNSSRSLRASVLSLRSPDRSGVNLGKLTHNPHLTLRNQPKVNVAYCRRSKIRTWGYTAVAIQNRYSKFATRNAGLPTGRSRGIPASLRNLNTPSSQVGRTILGEPSLANHPW